VAGIPPPINKYFFIAERSKDLSNQFLGGVVGSISNDTSTFLPKQLLLILL